MAIAFLQKNPFLKYSLGILFVLAIVYGRLLSFGFLNSWDDAEVLLNNQDVHTFNLKAFFTKQYVGNYAPLSMISFAIDWALFKGAAPGHHLINLVLHFVNCLLVFQLLRRLLKQDAPAFLLSLLFCIHPFQMETVGWIAAKNNLVAGVFFLWGLLAYLRFLEQKQRGAYALSFILFCLAALSKPSALCFPLCLFVIDLLKGLPFDRKAILQKLPFFVVAIVVGVITINTRAEANFLSDHHAYPFYQRLGFAGYALGCYLLRFVFPFRLSVIYPYPDNTALALTLGYALIIALVSALVVLTRRKKALYFRAGLLFFIMNLLLVLQFVPYGETLSADRYMYLAIIGLCLCVMEWLQGYSKNAGNFYMQPAIMGFWAFLILLGGLSFNRAKIWQSGIALYEDILKSYPRSTVALSSLGAEYSLRGNPRRAHQYLNAAIETKDADHKTFYNNGLVYAREGNYREALRNFDASLQRFAYPKAYVGRGNVYYSMGDMPKALKDAEAAIQLEPQNLKAYLLQANCYNALNQLPKALEIYNRLLTLAPKDPAFRLERAVVFGKMGEFGNCLSDLDQCLAMKPDMAEAYYWRGVAKYNLKQDPCPDLKQAYNLGFRQAESALRKYCAR